MTNLVISMVAVLVTVGAWIGVAYWLDRWHNWRAKRPEATSSAQHRKEEA